jgi:hypothetical protein
MKIQNKLIQFNNEKVLLLVTGAHYYIIYQASNGIIKKIKEDRIDEPTYSDNEGMFKSSSGEGAFGSVLESKKHKAVTDLSKSLSRESFNLIKKKKIDGIYLFTSPQIKADLSNDLHQDVKNMIISTYDGNYTKEKPFTLLEIIQKNKKKKPKKILKPEVKKILKKGKK